MKKLLKSKYKILGMLLMVFVPMFVWVSMAQRVEFTTTASVLPLKSTNPDGEIDNESDDKPIEFAVLSDKYIINEESFYIYTKTDVDEETIKSNITVTGGCIVSLDDNVLFVSNLVCGLGDVNQNGEIDSEDAQLVLGYVAGTSTLTNDQKVIADVNKNGNITGVDARIILQHDVVEYNVVNISSTKYDLSGETIILEDGGVTFDVNNIIVTNGYAAYDEESSTLLIYSESGELLDEFSVENITVTPEKPEVNPGTTDMAIGNLLFIGGFVLLITVYGFKRFKKIK